MGQNKVNLAIVGATGAVGKEMIKTVEQRKFPVDKIFLLASARSKGLKLKYKGENVIVDELTENSFRNKDIKIALFSAGGEISKKFAPIAARDGVVVVDNSSAFRMDDNIPLVVPEVNPDDIKNNKGIIANPNCSTIQMVVALKPIYDEAGIDRIVVSTYQAVSGAGLKAVAELRNQIEAILNNEKIENEIFPHQIGLNCIPHIGDFTENGYTKEELKMLYETRKIFGDQSIRVAPTTVRVPVFIGHSESVNVTTKRPVELKKVISLLAKAKGVTLIDNPSKNQYPLAIDCEGKDDVFVGRVRKDESVENGFDMWVVSDNLRKGAALNAVQIAEIILKEIK